MKIDMNNIVHKGGKFEMSRFRKEVSRLSSIANKRLKRLEKNDLTDSPAYKKVVESGEPKFSVKGKSFNETQKEFSRLKRFLESETSTIRGINNHLKEVANNTGMKYKNLKELRSKAPKFFELSSKVEQYLRQVEDVASAIGYQKIWEAVNQYVKEQKVDLAKSDGDIDDVIENIGKMLAVDGLEDDLIANAETSTTKGWVSLD